MWNFVKTIAFAIKRDRWDKNYPITIKKLTILARGAEERPVAGTLINVPKIRTGSVILTRVWMALVLAWTTRLCVHLLHTPVFLDIHLGDLHVVDDNVLNATNKRRGVVGQNLLVTYYASDEGIEIDSVVIARGVDGLSQLKPIIHSKGQVGSVDSHIHLLPLGVVQILSNENALILVDKIGVEV